MSIVSVSEAKDHLQIDATDTTHDAWLEGHIPTVELMVQNWTGRILAKASQVEKFDGFPGGAYIPLKYIPYVDITDIKYLDANGAEQTLGSGVYRVDERQLHAQVWEAYGQSFPATRSGAETVTVTYDAGYDTVPAPIRTAILMTLAQLDADRGDFSPGEEFGDLPLPVQAMLAPYRVYY